MCACVRWSLAEWATYVEYISRGKEERKGDQERIIQQVLVLGRWSGGAWDKSVLVTLTTGPSLVSNVSLWYKDLSTLTHDCRYLGTLETYTERDLLVLVHSIRDSPCALADVITTITQFSDASIGETENCYSGSWPMMLEQAVVVAMVVVVDDHWGGGGSPIVSWWW